MLRGRRFSISFLTYVLLALAFVGLNSYLSQGLALFAKDNTVFLPLMQNLPYPLAQIAYVKVGNDDPGIFVTDTYGNSMVKLTGSASRAGLDYSPDGQKLAFVTGEELYVMNADGSGIIQLTNNGRMMMCCPAWSPDGMQIAYSRWVGLTTVNQALYVINADGSNERQVTDPLAAQAYSDEHPTWSPDGSRIGFVRKYEQGYFQSINVLDLGNLTVTPLTAVAQRRYRDPAWSPDGAKIAFSAIGPIPYPIDYRSYIYVMNADGSGELRLTAPREDMPYSHSPVWSPDGKFLVFVADTSGESTLAIMRSDGTAVDLIVPWPKNMNFRESPDWRP